MSRCKHATQQWYDDRGAVDFVDVRRRTVRCTDCGAVLPLGPATMTPDVEVEVHAAWLAEGRKLTHLEQCGWDAHEQRTTVPSWAYPYAEWSGWLARQIATHDEEQSR